MKTSCASPSSAQTQISSTWSNRLRFDNTATQRRAEEPLLRLRARLALLPRHVWGVGREHDAARPADRRSDKKATTLGVASKPSPGPEVARHQRGVRHGKTPTLPELPEGFHPGRTRPPTILLPYPARHDHKPRRRVRIRRENRIFSASCENVRHPVSIFRIERCWNSPMNRAIERPAVEVIRGVPWQARR